MATNNRNGFERTSSKKNKNVIKYDQQRRGTKRMESDQEEEEEEEEEVAVGGTFGFSPRRIPLE